MGKKLHATLTVILAIAVVSLATYSVTLRSANRAQAQVLEVRFNSIIGHLETEHELELEIQRLKTKLGSQGSAPLGAATISNEEAVQIYADNEAEISALWVSMGGETTLGQAVMEWLKTHPLPQKVKP